MVKLLLVGATGYIGGSLLTTLQSSKHASIQALEISAVVRGSDRAKLLKDHGVQPILIDNLDDSAALTKAASEHDIVFNAASGFHTGAAKALVTGLGQRKKATGKEVYYLHTTGTSNIADKPLTKEYYEPRILSDRDDIYTYLRGREDAEAYSQRTTDLVVVDTGLEYGVKTLMVMSPTIYGVGSGLFNTTSIQIPVLVRAALERGQVPYIAEGNGVWDAVHIADLVTLYELLVAKTLAGEKLPFGKEGILFSETGDFSWRELSEGLAVELYKQGVLEKKEAQSLTLEEGAKVLSGGIKLFAELGYASNSRSRAERARELGWKPVRGRGAFRDSFEEEVRVVVKKVREVPVKA